MSCDCKNKCNHDQLAQALNAMAELRNKVDTLTANTKFLSCGHPILQLQNSDDIDLFDADGAGSKCWEGWAVCNGASYVTSKGKTIVTPDLRNNFIVAAGDDYPVNAVGGAKEVTLSINQMPVHSHNVVDSGHTHAVTDSGHTHALTQSPHSHGITDPGHEHNLNVTQAPNFHEFSHVDTTLNVNSGTGNDVPDTWTNNTDGYSVSVTMDTNITGITINNASISISANSATTGVSVVSANTGITIENEGGTQAHENRPPYYALLFVMKIG